ncbi:hypothetical protein HWV62_30711 [Athelia sp. TMB]|nr:hypothetical protein HWV62_30711 [Athelia sp. TMB]
MDRTPFEIWTKISSYACTDLGSTGRSLSLVSRFIREASAPAKLQSLSAHGLQQIIAFHETLLRTPRHLRRVRYLLLSTTPRSPSINISVDTSDHSLPEGKFEDSDKLSGKSEEERRERAEESEHSRQQLVITCRCVLQIVAECIEILYLDGHCPFYYLSDTTLFIFPRLEELTSTAFFFESPSGSDAWPNVALCPKLRRWHLTSYPLLWKEQDVFTIISNIAPSITHLRFSGLLPCHVDFPSHLKATLELIEPPQDVVIEKPKWPIGILPATIVNIFVKPAAAPKNERFVWINPRVSYDILVRKLEILSRADRRVVVLQSEKGSCQIRCTSGDFEERVNGGDGCWSLRAHTCSKFTHSTESCNVKKGYR